MELALMSGVMVEAWRWRDESEGEGEGAGLGARVYGRR